MSKVPMSPAQRRAFSTDRAKRLMADINECVALGPVNRRTTDETIAAAFEAVVAKLEVAAHEARQLRAA